MLVSIFSEYVRFAKVFELFIKNETFWHSTADENFIQHMLFKYLFVTTRKSELGLYSIGLYKLYLI